MILRLDRDLTTLIHTVLFLYSNCFISLPGTITTAAYRKWEKAAIAGVSLVADAAEHLERAATVKEVEHDQENPGSYNSGSTVKEVEHDPENPGTYNSGNTLFYLNFAPVRT